MTNCCPVRENAGAVRLRLFLCGIVFPVALLNRGLRVNLASSVRPVQWRVLNKVAPMYSTYSAGCGTRTTTHTRAVSKWCRAETIFPVVKYPLPHPGSQWSATKSPVGLELEWNWHCASGGRRRRDVMKDGCVRPPLHILL